MSSSFPDSFDEFAGDSPAATEIHSFDDSYVVPQAFSNFDSTAVDYPPPVYVSAGELPSDPSYFSSETNENAPILPPPAFMEPGYALREWRRQNAARLEEKERKEKDLLMQIIVAADEYKVAVNRKWVMTCETNRETNREKEMGFVASQEKFHAEADKDYWKSIADLIPKEVPTIEKKKGKKEQAKRPSIVVVQGPKPGKPTDLSRMRQLLLKLKHNTPPHLKPSPRTPEATTSAAVAATVAVAAEAVAVN